MLRCSSRSGQLGLVFVLEFDSTKTLGMRQGITTKLISGMPGMLQRLMPIVLPAQ